MVDDPWGYGGSLEWATSCPPPRHNFTSLPRIRSERPAFDLHHPEVAALDHAEPDEALLGAMRAQVATARAPSAAGLAVPTAGVAMSTAVLERTMRPRLTWRSRRRSHPRARMRSRSTTSCSSSGTTRRPGEDPDLDLRLHRALLRPRGHQLWAAHALATGRIGRATVRRPAGRHYRRVPGAARAPIVPTSAPTNRSPADPTGCQCVSSP